MALEDFANKLIYIPYANDVLSKISKKTVKNQEWKNAEASKYVSSVSAFWDKHQKLKKSCEIGVLGYLFNGIETEEYFKNYVLKKYPKTDMPLFKDYGEKLQKIAPRRNNAAHGGNYLTYDDVCTDKTQIYEVSAEKYKGLIIELLGLLLPN